MAVIFGPLVAYATVTVSGRVVAISDGDTLTLLTADRQQIKVRLACIDAPETSQVFGSAAKQHLSVLVFQKIGIAICRKRDRYGRHVCDLFVEQTNIGLRMIQDGMAWHFKRYANEQAPEVAESYAAAERGARGRRLGLWSKPGAVAPWAWCQARYPRN
jgi:endonuclease YncB( thermonuclease family)